MADYGHELLFGTFVTPAAADAHQVLELAALSDELGLDLLSHLSYEEQKLVEPLARFGLY